MKKRFIVFVLAAVMVLGMLPAATARAAGTGFTDVAAGAYYEKPVQWAVENGITTGATATTFDPMGTCLRSHVVTFLHRAAGSPEPGSAGNPFNDVQSGGFYYKAVLWAVEKGITAGVSPTVFGPNNSCTRAQVVTFLWRSVGSPEPKSANNPFVDVKTGDFYYKAVLWAVERGITTGLDATHFGPGQNCTRAQVVTFLYRCFYTETGSPLTITRQPEDVTAKIGDRAVFTVAAAGGKGGYSYQWQFMSNMQPNWLDITDDHGGLLSGYQTAELSVNVISDHYNDCYLFRCVVTDSQGNSVTSEAATVYEFVRLTIYSQPKDVYVSNGCYYEFSVAVGSGIPSYTYQWYWKMDGVGAAIPFDGTEGWEAEGYNTPTLGLIANEEMYGNNFFVFCKIADQSGDEVETNRAYVLLFFGVYSHTASQSVEVGRIMDIDVGVHGGKAPYSYQLQRRFGSDATFQNYGKAVSSYEKSHTVKEEMTPEILDMLPEYRYVITDANGTKAETDPFRIWKYTELTITSQPENAENVKVGDTVTFTVEAAGSDRPLSYQWYSRQVNGYVQFEKIEGATEAAYTHTFTEADRKYTVEFYCEVSDAKGYSVDSNTVRPTYSLWIKSQSKTQWDLTVDDTPTFLVTPAGGSGTYTYEWEIYFTQNNRWSSIQDKYSWIDPNSSSTHALKILRLKDWYECYRFRCKVSDGTDTVYSDVIYIDVT